MRGQTKLSFTEDAIVESQATNEKVARKKKHFQSERNIAGSCSDAGYGKQVAFNRKADVRVSCE